MTQHKIGQEDDFHNDRGTKVEINGIEIAVIPIDNELFGIQNRCPHKNLPLHIVGMEKFISSQVVDEGHYTLHKDGRDPNEDLRGAINEGKLSINCPWHSLEWDLETGENKPTGKCVATYDIEVQEDGSVWVEI